MLILTSSVAKVADHVYKKYLADTKYGSVLFIDTAAEPELIHGDEWLQADLASLCALGYRVDRYSVTDKTRGEVEAKMREYDILYMCGGNTAYLLRQLKKTDTFDLIQEEVAAGMPYIGTSAGSILAGPCIPEYFSDDLQDGEDGRCLGFVPFTIVPHWGDPHFKERYVQDRLERAYTDSSQPLLLLTDYQYVHVGEAGLVTLVDTHKQTTT